jgi:hypothetical protein
VRRIACDKQIRPLIEWRRGGATAIFGTLGAVSLAALAFFYAQVWRDGRNPDPLWLLSSVERIEQPQLIEWVRTHSSPDALVFGPEDVAPWLATIPRTGFATHDVFSITYNHQHEQAERVLKGELPLQALAEEYGIRIAVIPASSKAQVQQENWRADIGPWRVYEFPGAAMRPYPGLAVLDPTVKQSLRSRLLAWIAKRS